MIHRFSDSPVIVALARTPFGRFDGALAELEPSYLAARTIDEVTRRAGVPPERIDAVYAGIGMLGGATLTATRQAVLMSSLPETTPSLAVDRACCSGLTAIGLAWKDILGGHGQIMLCGGFESLSRTPLLWPRRNSRRPGTVTVDDPLLLRAPVVDRPIAVYTGEEALKHGVTRIQQDAWALGSHQRYWAAESRGFFGFERFSVSESVGDIAVRLDADESPRTDSSLDKLSKLRPVYGGLTVTAGNAPGLNDGAAFLLLMHPAIARELALTPLARILDYVQIASGPTTGTSTPAAAIGRLLQNRGMSPADLDLIEINEAYAATPLVSSLYLAERDPQKTEALRARTNVNGGAVAIGHPIGASGARIVMTLIAALRERGGGRGAAAICGGFGQGDALLLEVTDTSSG